MTDTDRETKFLERALEAVGPERPVSIVVGTLEEWREIPFLEGNYLISSMGRVFTREHKGKRRNVKAKILKGGIGKTTRYYQVSLPLPWGTTQVHNLVARVFIGPPPTPKHQVNHKNGIRSDCRVSNLEWVTASENILHGLHVLGGIERRKGEGAHNVKLTQAQVDWIRANSTGRLGEQAEYARKFGVTATTIRQIIQGKTWK